MKKLLSTAEFVLDQEVQIRDERKNSDTARTYGFDRCARYAKLMLRKPELWMFAPCDDDGNVLKKPAHYGNFLLGRRLPDVDSIKKCREWDEAKERCWFEGWKLHGKEIINSEGWKLAKEKTSPVWSLKLDGNPRTMQVDRMEFVENIEDIAREINLIPTKTLLKEIGLKG